VGEAAGQHLEQEDPERVDVASRVDAVGLAPGLLGRHVQDGAHHRAGDRHAALVGGRGLVTADRLGQAEVEQLGGAVRRDHHVGRLEVAVDHAALVGELHGPGDRGHGRDHVAAVDAGAAGRAEVSVERHAVDELHRVVPVPAVDAAVVHAGDVLVLEAGGQFDLALEADDRAGRPRGRRPDHLERDDAAGRGLLGLPDDAHAPLAQSPEDAVARDARGARAVNGRRADGRRDRHRDVRVRAIGRGAGGRGVQRRPGRRAGSGVAGDRGVRGFVVGGGHTCTRGGAAPD
jgi:hypothetical protein